MSKPFAPACERNQDAILQILRIELANARLILEVGSGTGQHAVYFAKALQDCKWQTSDRVDNHAGIQMWLNESNLPNVLPPLAFDVKNDHVQPNHYDAVFTANTFHIMSWDEVKLCIEKVSNALKADGKFVIYGPFNLNGAFTASSNQQFDAQLRAEDANMGIRHFEDVEAHAKQVNLRYHKKYPMPANNLILVFQKDNK